MMEIVRDEYFLDKLHKKSKEIIREARYPYWRYEVEIDEASYAEGVADTLDWLLNNTAPEPKL